MKVCCIQMNMELGCPEHNFAHACRLTEQAMAGSPDVILLPETWNTGFYPAEGLAEMSYGAAETAASLIGTLARRHSVNIIAGSISDTKNGRVYNTSTVFDRAGNICAEYSKTHLFSPLGENLMYSPGNSLCTFDLDGIKAGLIICYDIRFPELARSLALKGMDVLFMVSQWPDVRIPQLHTLAAARAIENQAFVVCCNSCGRAGPTQFGGRSVMAGPLGNILAEAGPHEELLYGDLDIAALPGIRTAIPVFNDRRPDIYDI